MQKPHSQRKMGLCAYVNLHADTHCVTTGRRSYEWPCDCACVTAPPDGNWCVCIWDDWNGSDHLLRVTVTALCVYTVIQEEAVLSVTD